MSEADLPEVMETDRLCLPRPWSEALWREEMESPFSLYLILEEGGEICGHIGLKLISDEAHVMTIAVRSEKRRRGHARTLIQAALAVPVAAGARRVYLEVRPSNVAARTLYESLGFRTTAIRRGYYGDEDALLMTLDLEHG
jgi:ribosomal-protein-alanine N-acetyltransferase